jgi:hypothetical protein
MMNAETPENMARPARLCLMATQNEYQEGTVRPALARINAGQPGKPVLN